jgi:predicted metallopeptidase
MQLRSKQLILNVRLRHQLVSGLRKLPLKYLKATDVKQLVDEIVDKLDLSHVISQSVHCFRSRGSKSRCIIARIHGLGRIWQTALGHSPAYIIEVISEHYDRLSQGDKEKTLIHELMHIPKGFKGGFRPHKGYISRKRIEKMHKEYIKRRDVHPQVP